MRCIIGRLLCRVWPLSSWWILSDLSLGAEMEWSLVDGSGFGLEWGGGFGWRASLGTVETSNQTLVQHSNGHGPTWMPSAP